MITDNEVIETFYSNNKIVNPRLRSKKFLTGDLHDYILNRTSFLPQHYTTTQRLIVIKEGWREHKLCQNCHEQPVKFTRGAFTKFCGYSCSNSITAKNRVEKKYLEGKINPVDKNLDLFENGFRDGKSIIEICSENNLNYKGARGKLLENGIDSPSRFDHKTSLGEKEIIDFLMKHNEECESVYKDGKEIDIFIEKRNIGIEYDGIYWHSDEYRSKNHLIEKNELFAKTNISILHLWDVEWAHKRPICESIILSRLGKYKRKIYAKNCYVKEIPNNVYKGFLLRNHIQGYRGSSVRLGLFAKQDDALVSVMGFNKLQSKTEMTRFCNEIFTLVVGGSNKLFSHFIKNYRFTELVSFSDERLFTGDMYKKLGFTHSHTSKPNYFYFGNNATKLHSRVAFQKHKLSKKLASFDPLKSEYENMVVNGYKRIWDCGNKVWVYS